MKYANELKVGDIGYVIYYREITKVTVACITDISYHGSPDDVFYVQELAGYFRKLYDLNEVQQQLLQYLEYDKNDLEDDKDKILYKIKELNKKINRLKKEMK